MQIFPTFSAFLFVAALGASGATMYGSRIAHAGAWPASATIAFVLGAVGLVALVVERRRYRRAARLLKHERDVSRRLFDGSTNAVLLVDANGRVTEVNPAFERFIGVARRDARQLSFDALPGFGTPENVECLRLALLGVECASGWRYEDAVSRRVCYSPTRDARGRVSGAIVLVTFDDSQPARREWFERRHAAAV